ncbi:hypothetical protein [Nonomuraea maritima]|uniref:hypothetical protein n=1 Tax=Nonomuraea maritima TaxID=683260 RepID=UPI003713F7CE
MQALLHTVAGWVGCVLALVPALLPSARPTRRWPYVVMALGMAAGHLGGMPRAVAVLVLLAAGWLCGSPRRRDETGHHIQDFVAMSLLLVLTASGGPVLGGHAHAGGSPAVLALVIGVVWTCGRLVRLLAPGDGTRGQDVCAAGMAASMSLMTALAL